MIERSGSNCCHMCGKPGKFVRFTGRLWQIAVLKCRTCVYTYQTFWDGKIEKARPIWSIPRKELFEIIPPPAPQRGSGRRNA